MEADSIGQSREVSIQCHWANGELAVNNRLAEQPQIVARLEAKLNAWSAALQPPGPPEADNGQDNAFFAAHVKRTAELTPKPPRNGTTAPTIEDGLVRVDGWSARNGTLDAKDGVLWLTADLAAPKIVRPFITHSSLDLAGPVTATLRVRAKTVGKPGQYHLAYETRQLCRTSDHQLNWPAGTEWQEVRVAQAEQSRILHIRIHPPQNASGIEIDSIELKGNDASKVFHFNSEPKKR